MKTSINSLSKSLIMSCALALSAQSAMAATTFKIALGGSLGSSQEAMATKFIETLKSETGGKYDAALYPNSQLGSEQDTVNNAAMGLLDFSVVAINNLTPFSPSLGVLQLPYVVRTIDEAVKLTQSSAGDALVENTIRDAGVRIVGWTFSGFRVLTNSNRPVKTLADLQGLIIRVPKNELMIDTYKAWGVNPTPMAWSEVFTALQMKVVDGQDLSLIDIESSRFYEVQKYITKIHYNFLLEPLVMSESIFQSQPKDVQDAILTAGKEASKYSEAFLRKMEAGALESLLKQGMEMVEPDEKEWISRATTEVWPKYYEPLGGKVEINKVLRALGREEI